MITNEKRELACKLANRHDGETLALMFVSADASLTGTRDALTQAIKRQGALERLLVQRSARINDLERQLVQLRQLPTTANKLDELTALDDFIWS